MAVSLHLQTEDGLETKVLELAHIPSPHSAYGTGILEGEINLPSSAAGLRRHQQALWEPRRENYFKGQHLSASSEFGPPNGLVTLFEPLAQSLGSLPVGVLGSNSQGADVIVLACSRGHLKGRVASALYLGGGQ
jgi:hypothetical protein